MYIQLQFFPRTEFSCSYKQLTIKGPQGICSLIVSVSRLKIVVCIYKTGLQVQDIHMYFVLSDNVQVPCAHSFMN